MYFYTCCTCCRSVEPDTCISNIMREEGYYYMCMCITTLCENGKVII